MFGLSQGLPTLLEGNLSSGSYNKWSQASSLETTEIDPHGSGGWESGIQHEWIWVSHPFLVAKGNLLVSLCGRKGPLWGSYIRALVHPRKLYLHDLVTSPVLVPPPSMILELEFQHRNLGGTQIFRLSHFKCLPHFFLIFIFLLSCVLYVKLNMG